LQDGWPNGNMASLAKDNKGRLWFAKAGIMGLFQNGKFEVLYRFPFAQFPPQKTVVRLCSSRTGGVWVCAGLQLFHYDVGKPLQLMGDIEPENTGASPSVLLEASDGAVWIGTTS